MNIIEIIGYIGSAIVLFSFLMTSVVKLRIVNSLGSLIFMIYALIIRSYPTAVMNLCLVLINIHFLWKMFHTKKVYDIVSVKKDDSFLNYMISSFRDDILKCFPGISLDFNEMNAGYITCCKGVPAGILLAKENSKDMNLLLDYTTPEYRDFSIGSFLMQKLKSDGIQKLLYKGPDVNHQRYLQKLGFTKNESVWEKDL